MTKRELLQSALHAFINDVFSDPATAVKYALNCDISEFRDFSERLARMGCTVCHANGIEDDCHDKYGCPGCIKLLQSEVDTEFEILLREFFVKLRGECE